MILDRLLWRMLWVSVLGLIAVAAGSALLFTCHGLFDLLGGDWKEAIGHLFLGLLMSLASYLLCRNANDLMDR